MLVIEPPLDPVDDPEPVDEPPALPLVPVLDVPLVDDPVDPEPVDPEPVLPEPVADEPPLMLEPELESMVPVISTRLPTFLFSSASCPSSM